MSASRISISFLLAMAAACVAVAMALSVSMGGEWAMPLWWLYPVAVGFGAAVYVVRLALGRDQDSRTRVVKLSLGFCFFLGAPASVLGEMASWFVLGTPPSAMFLALLGAAATSAFTMSVRWGASEVDARSGSPNMLVFFAMAAAALVPGAAALLAWSGGRASPLPFCALFVAGMLGAASSLVPVRKAAPPGAA